MFWALALLSLSLAAGPAATQPVAAKGKAAAAPAKTATKTVAKAPPARVPTKPGARPAATTTAARTATPNRATPSAAARGRVQQPQYSRYSNTRRPMATSRTAAGRPRPVYHPVQSVPTPERTKEIQSALVRKGYLNSEPSGAWDADSIAAMKRFQKDQNLEADGKFSSLSLIALGLGPKRTLTATSVNPAAAGSAPSPSTTNPVPPKP